MSLPSGCVDFTSASSADKAAALQHTIEQLPRAPKVLVVQANLASLIGPQDLVDATLAWLRSTTTTTTIDILVNNAGVELRSPSSLVDLSRL